MCRPTRRPFRGRLIGLGERAKTRPRRCTGVVAAACTRSLYTGKAQATREAPRRGRGRPSGHPRGTGREPAAYHIDDVTRRNVTGRRPAPPRRRFRTQCGHEKPSALAGVCKSLIFGCGGPQPLVQTLFSDGATGKRTAGVRRAPWRNVIMPIV